jgi:hypothetical protein
MRTRAGRRASVAETQEPYYLKMQRLLGNRAVSRGGQHGASQVLRAAANSQTAPANQTPAARKEAAKQDDRTAFMYVWRRVESEVGASSDAEAIRAAFLEVAQDMGDMAWASAVISDMSSRLDDLVSDFVAGATVEQMWERFDS